MRKGRIQNKLEMVEKITNDKRLLCIFPFPRPHIFTSSRYPILSLSLFLILSFTHFPILSSSHLPILSNAWAATYYIDATNGNDANNGLSEATPWKTISKVNASSFNPGDQILFKRGDVWREQLNIPSSGAETSPITFGAYGMGDRFCLAKTGEMTGSTGSLYSGSEEGILILKTILRSCFRTYVIYS